MLKQQSNTNDTYGVTVNNCLEQSYIAFSKGTLKDGANVGKYVGDMYTLIPKNAEATIKEAFFNNRFTRKAAKMMLSGKRNRVQVYIISKKYSQKHLIFVKC